MFSRNEITRYKPIAVALLVVFAFVIVPFLLWGEQIESIANLSIKHYTESPTRWALLALGIALLTLDVLLPIPSSLVAIAMCIVLGPIVGAIGVFFGLLASFFVGYYIGRMFHRQSLRGQLPISYLLIVLSRPLPVLAEAVALLAGATGVPIAKAGVFAACSSAIVALTYGAVVYVGPVNAESSAPRLAMIAITLPSVLWAIAKITERRFKSKRLSSTIN
jgi:uncharacterized membrane protein YdjX (TVP38/TMEM64 family)